MAKLSFTCPPCGHVITAESEPEMVQKIQEHAKQAHGVTLSEAQAREAMQAAQRPGG